MPTPQIITQMFRSHRATIEEQEEQLVEAKVRITKMDRYIDKKENELARIKKKFGVPNEVATTVVPTSVSELLDPGGKIADPEADAAFARLVSECDEPVGMIGGE